MHQHKPLKPSHVIDFCDKCGFTVRSEGYGFSWTIKGQNDGWIFETRSSFNDRLTIWAMSYLDIVYPNHRAFLNLVNKSVTNKTNFRDAIIKAATEKA